MYTITGIAHGYAEENWHIYDPATGKRIADDFTGHIVSYYGDTAKIISVTPETIGTICEATARNIEFQPYHQ